MSTAADTMVAALRDSAGSGTKPYDTTATVKRIEGSTVWVHIPGGVDETPVKKTIDAKEGDEVQVRIADGKAWLVGNASAPPTDDTTAVKAKNIASEANDTAVRASGEANAARRIATDTAQYFWASSGGSDNGAHVTQVDRAEFESTPSGGNTLITSNGVAVRDGLTELATFGADGAQIGQSGGAHSVIDTKGQRFYGGSDGTTQLANIGYGETAGESSATNAPFYTFGIRKTASEYDPTATYSVDELCLHNGVLYICVVAITTPEAWDGTKWSRAVGSYSVSEGYDTIAKGYCSHAEGGGSKALGSYSHAEGSNTTARGQGSHAEGGVSEASGIYSHAEGFRTTASAYYSHAEGYETQAVTQYAHAEGMQCVARGQASHAQNYHTQTSTESQTAIGKYNDNKSANLFEVGNGTADDARSNAFEVGRNGNVTASGSVTDSSNTTLLNHNSLLVEEKTLIDDWTVTRNGNNYTSVSVAKTGYTALGVVGFRLQNATTGGAYNTFCSQHSMYMSAANTVWFLIRNNSTSNDAKIKVIADILYMKN